MSLGKMQKAMHSMRRQLEYIELKFHRYQAPHHYRHLYLLYQERRHYQNPNTLLLKNLLLLNKYMYHYKYRFQQLFLNHPQNRLLLQCLKWYSLIILQLQLTQHLDDRLSLLPQRLHNHRRLNRDRVDWIRHRHQYRS